MPATTALAKQSESKIAVSESKTKPKKRKNSLDDVVQRIVDLFYYVKLKRPLEPEVKQWAEEEEHLEKETVRFLYHQTKKREEVEIASEYLQNYALPYIKALQEKLKIKGYRFVVVGGFATYLYSAKAQKERAKRKWFSEPYNTQDIDLKMCRLPENLEEKTINQMREILDEVIIENKKLWPGILSLYDPTNILIRTKLGKFEKKIASERQAERRADPNLPLKITAPIATSFKKGGSPIEPIVEITFSNTEVPDDIIEFDDMSVFSARDLIEILMSASENFVERMRGKERNLYMGKLYSWQSQLKYLVRYESEKKYKTISTVEPSIYMKLLESDEDNKDSAGASAAAASAAPASKGGRRKKSKRRRRRKKHQRRTRKR